MEPSSGSYVYEQATIAQQLKSSTDALQIGHIKEPTIERLQ